MSTNAKRYTIRAVDRALDLVTAFSTLEPELTVTHLSSRLGLPVSTIYRLLVTLESRGFIEQNPQTAGYRLGVACADLGTVFLSQLNLRERVLPLLEALRADCKETVHLAVLDPSRMEVIYLEKLEGLLPIGMMGSRVGGRAPAHCTGLGKCMLAHLAEGVVSEFYATNGLRRFTPNTITDLDELLRELKQVRQEGYATDDGEHGSEVRCVAAPVFDHHKAAIGAISVAGPTERIGRLIDESSLVGRVKNSAHDASLRMGYVRTETCDTRP